MSQQNTQETTTQTQAVPEQTEIDLKVPNTSFWSNIRDDPDKLGKLEKFQEYAFQGWSAKKDKEQKLEKEIQQVRTDFTNNYDGIVKSVSGDSFLLEKAEQLQRACSVSTRLSEHQLTEAKMLMRYNLRDLQKGMDEKLLYRTESSNKKAKLETGISDDDLFKTLGRTAPPQHTVPSQSTNLRPQTKDVGKSYESKDEFLKDWFKE